jgi:hypothetical protein
MSSNVRMHASPWADPIVRPAPRTIETSLGDSEVLSLTPVLGMGGRQGLAETLDGLEGTKRELIARAGQDNVTPAALGWQKEGGGRYRLTLEANALPAELAWLGATVSLSLELNNQTAKVKRTVTYRQKETAAAAPRQSVQEALRRTCNRAVNELLALNAAREMTRHLATYRHVVRETVQTRLTQQVRHMAYYQAKAYVSRQP